MGAISVGIAALAVGVALKSGVSLGVGSAGPLAEVPRLSTFAAMSPNRFSRGDFLGQGIPYRPYLQLASLETEIGSEVEWQEGSSEPRARRNVSDSFDERFSSDGHFASFDERFAGETASRRGGTARTAGTEEVVLAAPDKGERPAKRPAPGRPAPQVTLASLSPLAGAAKKRLPAADISTDSPPSDDDSHTAIYDITAHTVYLPDGRRLEAHSGLGDYMDNVRFVSAKGRGVTPPNVYDLALREQIFHGVRAIRLIPVDDGKMFGRDGMLAHSYMLGPNGQSNGCVSFKDYPAFLDAFLKGEVDRLVVVEHLAAAPSPKTASGWIPDAIKDLFRRS